MMANIHLFNHGFDNIMMWHRVSLIGSNGGVRGVDRRLASFKPVAHGIILPISRDHISLSPPLMR